MEIEIQEEEEVVLIQAQYLRCVREGEGELGFLRRSNTGDRVCDRERETKERRPGGSEEGEGCVYPVRPYCYTAPVGVDGYQ